MEWFDLIDEVITTMLIVPLYSLLSKEKSKYKFGSYARKEQNDNSDLDFLIVANDKMGLFEYVEFYQELEKEFDCHVDVVTSGIDDKDFLNIIEKNKKVLYAV